MRGDEAVLHQIERLVGIADMRQDQPVERVLMPCDDRGIGPPAILPGAGQHDQVAIGQRRISAAHRPVSVSLAATSRSKVAA